MAKIELNIITRGRSSGGAKKEVVSTIRDCYRRFGSKAPYKIEILIAENEAMKRDFLREEKFRLGITSDDNEESACSHDAWRGYPRITVSLEKLAELTKLARLGALRHEAAHSALHGGLEYRIFKIPEDCRQISIIKGVDLAVLDQAVYHLAAAVKDCEASKFLIDHDFINCQAAFALEWLKSPVEAKLAHKSAKADRQALFIHKTALLKPVLFAHPLLSLPKSKKISLERQVLLGRRIEELVEDLPDHEQNKLLEIAGLIVEELTQDTHKNVDFALHQAMSLA